MTPSGRPASTSCSTAASAVREPCTSGRRTTALPATSAGSASERPGPAGSSRARRRRRRPGDDGPPSPGSARGRGPGAGCRAGMPWRPAVVAGDDGTVADLLVRVGGAPCPTRAAQEVEQLAVRYRGRGRGSAGAPRRATRTGVAAQARCARRAASTATVTSRALDSGRTPSGAPVIGVVVRSSPPSPDATTRAVRVRTRDGATAYVAAGSVSGSAMTSAITEG